MNIEVKIDKNYENPQILILTNQMTSELSVIIDKISNITQETLQTYKDQKLYILGQNEIESIYSETEKFTLGVQTKYIQLKIDFMK